MIGHLRGVIKQKRESSVVLECHGVGYEVVVPKGVPVQLPEIDEPAVLQTHLHVRPESQSLYGFMTVAERDMFRILINISKIGPSHAINILSELKLSDLVACVRYEDPKPLQKVPRLGKATAAKLLIELSSKIDHIVEVAELTDMPDVAPGDYLEDAVEALAVMGFSYREARSAVSSVRDQADTTEHVIRLALISLGSTGT